MFSRVHYLKLRLRRTLDWAKLGWAGKPLLEAVVPGAVLQGWHVTGHVSIPSWMLHQEPSPIVAQNFMQSPDSFPRLVEVQDATGVSWNRPMTRQELDNTLRTAHLA